MKVFHKITVIHLQECSGFDRVDVGWWDICWKVFSRLARVHRAMQETRGLFALLLIRQEWLREKKYGIRQLCQRMSLFPRKRQQESILSQSFSQCYSCLKSAEVRHVFIYPVSLTDHSQNHLDCTTEELVLQPQKKICSFIPSKALNEY